MLSIHTVQCMEIFGMVEREQFIDACKLMERKDFNPNIVDPDGEPLIFLIMRKEYFILADRVIGNAHCYNQGYSDGYEKGTQEAYALAATIFNKELNETQERTKKALLEQARKKNGAY